MLDDLMIKMCENLPFDIAPYEEEGYCTRPNDVCQYSKRVDADNYFCHKKTYTPNLRPASD